MQILQIPSHSVSWPRLCACCLAPPTHTVPTGKSSKLFLGILSLKRTLNVSVPYCEPCMQHAKWSSGGRYLGIILKVVLVFFATTGLGFAAGMGALAVLDMPRTLLAQVVLFFFALVAPIVLTAMFLRRELKRIPRLDSIHSSKGHAVEVVAFDKSSITVKLHNDDYGKQLAAANGLG